MPRGTILPLPAIVAGLAILLLGGCRPGNEAAEPAAAAEAFSAGEILGRPTDRALALALVAAVPLEAQVEWGSASGSYAAFTALRSVAAGETFSVVLDGLAPDSTYYYRVRFRPTGESGFSTRREGRFRTCRATGSPFVFTVQADSHLDENSDLALYRQTLANILADTPDFHIDLGDTFMCDKHSEPLSAVVQPAPDQATVDARYLYERANFGLAAFSMPLFLVNGNHEGEMGRLLDGREQNIAVWATRARQRFFLNPLPDGFYSGDEAVEPLVGQRAAWYAWQWGDALFVVLDPYWNTQGKAGSDGWIHTLGERQYRWLSRTLAASPAPFKFVFIHNLVGGLDGQMRGGIEAAPYFEWGGRDLNGVFAFTGKRPGWELPIHQLLVRNGVTAVFHGHDHLYARQQLDGVLYLEVPQPSTRNTASGANLAAQFHYASGTILSSSGHLRVTVGPAGVKLEYVRAWLPADETAQRRNGQVDDSWTLGAGHDIK